jgi:hypothetical protein
MNAAAVAQLVFRHSSWPYLVVGCVSMLVAGGLLLLFGLFAPLLSDPYEWQAMPNFQLSCAASRIEEVAQARGGVFPAPGEVTDPLLAPKPATAHDPWGRPFRYELLTADASRARILSLGRDGKPGGKGIDEDIVYWMSSDGHRMTWDATNPPEGWR